MNWGENHPLPIALSCAVPLRIFELERRGGPTEDDFQKCRDFGQVLGEKGDLLLFRSKVPGETANLFNRLAQCIAVMSFVPGGITVFKQHYESSIRIGFVDMFPPEFVSKFQSLLE